MAKKETHINESAIDELYHNIKRTIEEGRNQAYRRANFAMVESYWNTGRLIVEDELAGKQRAEYGKEVIKKLAVRLIKSSYKGFNERNLWYMKQFYLTWPILNAVRAELSWTHHRLLLTIEIEEIRAFYIREATEGKWSTRTLERQINSLYYERMLMTPEVEKSLVQNESLEKKEEMQASDIIKDPYVLEFLGLKGNCSFYEKELEQAIIDKLQEFLLELGKGFSFVGRQYRLSAGGGKNFYADLVFYNYILKCFLIIDLKVGELTHQDIGQMDMYVRYFEDQIKQENDNPTIGLILCTERNKTVVKYSLLNDSKHIFASRYKIYLPSEDELKAEIVREREIIEQEKRLNFKK